jgi:hypothetical protein
MYFKIWSLLAKYYSCDQIKEKEMGGECGMQWENRNAFRVLVGKLERKRALARTARTLEDNIKMELQELGWQGSK